MAFDSQTWRRWVLVLGSLGPLGYLPASGSMTVLLVGVPVFYFTRNWTVETHSLTLFGWIVVSILIHHFGDRWLGEKDSQKLVWDELAGFWVAVAFVPFSWPLAAAAVLIERTLDILKFPPAGAIERHWPGAWGVVGDDVVAGLYTCSILHLAIAFAPNWFGVS